MCLKVPINQKAPINSLLLFFSPDGQYGYFEPIHIIDMNNKLRLIHDNIRKEEENVLRMLTEFISSSHNNIQIILKVQKINSLINKIY